MYLFLLYFFQKINNFYFLETTKINEKFQGEASFSFIFLLQKQVYLKNVEFGWLAGETILLTKETRNKKI